MSLTGVTGTVMNLSFLFFAIVLVPVRSQDKLITSVQVIFGQILKGAVSFDKVVSVKYLPGTPLITVPGIMLEYKREDGRMESVTIRFPGFTAKLAGFNPEAVYHLIAQRVDTKDEPAG
jgi:hypothetical protein